MITANYLIRNSQAKMPGLLQTQAEHFTKSKYIMALCAEFLGSCLFSFTGSALLSVALANPEEPNVVMAALGNGAGIAIAGTTFCLSDLPLAPYERGS